jgi:AraC family transcriptional regulator
MEPRIVDMEAFTVVGLVYRGKNENNEIPQMWQGFGARAQEIKHVRNHSVCYGISANMDEATHEFDYCAGFEVSSVEEIPAGMASFTVPAGTYAVFSTTLPKIGETFMYAYRTWLPQSKYQPTGGPEFELYDEAFDPADPESKFDLYIPIR